MSNEGCLLGKGEGAQCKAGAKCAGCGWNQKEDRRRKEIQRLYGLFRCADGLYRVDIRIGRK